MTCDDWKAFVHDYVLAELSEPARALLGRHAAECASCLAEAHALQAVDRHLAGIPMQPVPAGLADRVMARIPQPARHGFRNELVRMAAALLVVAGLGLAATTSLVQENIPRQVQQAPAALFNAAHGIPGVFTAITE